jgi:hypothetical protein
VPAGRCDPVLRVGELREVGGGRGAVVAVELVEMEGVTAGLRLGVG